MSAVLTNFGGLAASGGNTAHAYEDIKKPEEVTLTGQYKKNPGIRKPLGPIGPVYSTPTTTIVI
jgi:hypothetical protein